ncbi:5446_t:CDS:2 [Entrophospora sp. SA101]|nr:5446_t:CDS:2 [Entrophospora sp. SA101]
MYDVLVDVFNLERNPAIRSDAQTLLQVGETLRRALLIALRVSSSQATDQKFQEVAVNLQTALGTLGRRINADLSGWAASVKRNAAARELTLAGTAIGRRATINYMKVCGSIFNDSNIEQNDENNFKRQ